MSFQTDNSGIHSAGRAANGEATHIIDVLNFLDFLIYSIFIGDLHISAELGSKVRASTIESAKNIFLGNESIDLIPQYYGRTDLEAAAQSASECLERALFTGMFGGIDSEIGVPENTLYPNRRTITDQYEGLHDLIGRFSKGEPDLLELQDLANNSFADGTVSNVFHGVVGRSENVINAIRAIVNMHERWDLRDTVLLETHIRTFFNTSLALGNAANPTRTQCIYLPSAGRALLTKPYTDRVRRTLSAPREWLRQVDGLTHKAAQERHWNSNPPRFELFSFPSLTAALLASASDSIESVVEKALVLREKNTSVRADLREHIRKFGLHSSGATIGETVRRNEPHLKTYMEPKVRVILGRSNRNKRDPSFRVLDLGRVLRHLENFLGRGIKRGVEDLHYDARGKRHVLALGELTFALSAIQDHEEVRVGFERLCVASGLRKEAVDAQIGLLSG